MTPPICSTIVKMRLQIKGYNMIFLSNWRTTTSEGYIQFLTIASADRTGIEERLTEMGYTNVALLEALLLDEDYEDPVKFYIFTEDNQLRNVFTKYREQIAEHYGKEDCWTSFEDEYAIDN